MRKVLVVGVLVLLALVVAADRGLHYATENEVGNQVARQYPMTAEPDVTIGGFPFLTQVIAGTYSEVNVVTGAFTYNEVQLERVDVTLTDVEAPLSDLLSGEPDIVAEEAEGTILVPYSELQQRIQREGMTIEQEGGTPRITGDFAHGGISVSVQSDLELAVEESTISVSPRNIEVSGDVPIDVDLVEDSLAFELPLGELPFGLRVTDIQTEPNGLEVTAEGEDVPVAGVPTGR
ncbi:DUF2993 domain-containing protein [Lipingzhangella sp. LS1_29]|uniref:DUF2993 domain-containing protein n=1 Tax=Lipingzhangella rawalii TaxID=2055835 RepID=A0ABU2H9C8_9ACTN|nr:DUF2993 domain-containing protein [Lipingzhangella rawalii]MDS1271912.1 DUF2993 domain-containing protein [Lipingzhangella rawalii]